MKNFKQYFEENINSLNDNEYFHGTGMEFDTLKPTSHSIKHPLLFLTKDYNVAKAYAIKNKKGKIAKIYKVTVESNKMFDPFDNIGMIEEDGIFDDIKTIEGITEEDVERGEWTLYTAESGEKFMELLKSKGYDSAKIKEGYYARELPNGKLGPPTTEYSYGFFYEKSIKNVETYEEF